MRIPHRFWYATFSPFCYPFYCHIHYHVEQQGINTFLSSCTKSLKLFKFSVAYDLLLSYLPKRFYSLHYFSRTLADNIACLALCITISCFDISKGEMFLFVKFPNFRYYPSECKIKPAPVLLSIKP